MKVLHTYRKTAAIVLPKVNQTSAEYAADFICGKRCDRGLSAFMSSLPPSVSIQGRQPTYTITCEEKLTEYRRHKMLPLTKKVLSKDVSTQFSSMNMMMDDDTRWDKHKTIHRQDEV